MGVEKLASHRPGVETEAVPWKRRRVTLTSEMTGTCFCSVPKVAGLRRLRETQRWFALQKPQDILPWG